MNRNNTPKRTPIYNNKSHPRQDGDARHMDCQGQGQQGSGRGVRLLYGGGDRSSVRDVLDWRRTLLLAQEAVQGRSNLPQEGRARSGEEIPHLIETQHAGELSRKWGACPILRTHGADRRALQRTTQTSPRLTEGSGEQTGQRSMAHLTVYRKNPSALPRREHGQRHHQGIATKDSRQRKRRKAQRKRRSGRRRPRKRQRRNQGRRRQRQRQRQRQVKGPASPEVRNAPKWRRMLSATSPRTEQNEMRLTESKAGPPQSDAESSA